MLLYRVVLPNRETQLASPKKNVRPCVNVANWRAKMNVRPLRSEQLNDETAKPRTTVNFPVVETRKARFQVAERPKAFFLAVVE
jgi:hypothetical protein